MTAYQAKQLVSRFLAVPTANRATGTTDGALMQLLQASSAMVPTSALLGRTVTKVVAASNASAAMVAQADYVCDGVADEVEINAALAALPASGGTVLLSEGTFTLAAPIIFGAVRRVLRGMGMGATTLVVVNAGGAPINAVVVSLNADYCEASDFTFDGNKANNASATGMAGVWANGIGVLIERVRVVNSPQTGLGSGTTAANGVIRDCLAEGSVANGVYVRASSGQPMVVSGCTAKSNGSGFICDSGPVVLSDCQAISNTGVGFSITQSGISLSNCSALSNGSYGFSVTAADAKLVGCRAEGNVGRGFSVDAARVQLQGCLAASTVNPNAIGFISTAAGVDGLYVGCQAIDTPFHGFYSVASGPVTYVGCQSLNSSWYGWMIEAGEAHLKACYAYGNTAGGGGILITAGANHTIDGCRVTNTGGHGIYVQAAVTSAQITNNQVSSSSLAAGANGVYSQIAVESDNTLIAGNMVRDPSSGNRPGYGIIVTSESDGSLIGLNDTAGSGITNVAPQSAELYVINTTARRTAKLQLDYVASTDLVNGLAMAINTWYDVGSDQSFQVSSPRSVVQIAVRGCMQIGASASAGGGSQTRLLFDGVTTRVIGGCNNETTLYQNPFTGVASVYLQGFTVGTHTLRVQVHTRLNAKTAYLRAASAPSFEFLSIQVVELAR